MSSDRVNPALEEIVRRKLGSRGVTVNPDPPQGTNPDMTRSDNVPVFDPSQAANLQGWWDASSLTGADASAISSIADKSGKGRALAQSTGSLQPLLKLAIKNNLSVARFDGIDDVMGKTFALGLPYSYYIVFSYRSATGGQTDVCDGGTANQASIATTAGPAAAFFGTNGNNLSSGVTPTVGSWFVASCLCSVGSKEIHLNGGAGATNTNAAEQDPGGFTWGANGTGSGFWAPVDIGESFIYSGLHSAVQRKQLEGYLGSRWAIALT